MVNNKCKEQSCSGRKYTNCSQLKLLEKINIVHMAFVDQETYSNISNEYNVRLSTISYLVKKAKKEPEYF